MQIGTHNGIFHADDAMAVAILREVFGLLPVVRTRDPKVLAVCDFVVDVGAVYDHGARLYDHHQVGRAGERENGILYSAAGLVWKHYGPRLGSEEVVQMVDRDIISAIDASDNGQSLFVGGTAAFEGSRPFSFSGFIASLNPTWAEEKYFDEAFEEAVRLCSTALRRSIANAVGVIKARGYVEDALGKRETKAMVLLDKFVPWQDTVVRDDHALFVVFPSETGTWMVQAVPPEAGSFEKRRALPEAWAGLRGAALQALTVPGAVFCHPGRFICGHETKEGAIEMAKMALPQVRACTCGEGLSPGVAEGCQRGTPYCG